MLMPTQCYFNISTCHLNTNNSVIINIFTMKHIFVVCLAVFLTIYLGQNNYDLFDNLEEEIIKKHFQNKMLDVQRRLTQIKIELQDIDQKTNVDESSFDIFFKRDLSDHNSTLFSCKEGQIGFYYPTVMCSMTGIFGCMFLCQDL